MSNTTRVVTAAAAILVSSATGTIGPVIGAAAVDCIANRKGKR